MSSSHETDVGQMDDRQRALKRERDKRYREKKRQHQTDQRSELSNAREPNWTRRDKRELVDIIRTEIRLRHRRQAAREMAHLEARALARYRDLIHLGQRIQVESFADIEELVGLSRRELFELSAREPGPGFVEYGGYEA